MQNRPFRLSRRRLAAWYTGVMTLILMFCGLVIHRLIVHARWLNLVQEMQQLADMIKNQIDPVLQQPGVFDPAVRQLLPNLCIYPADCTEAVNRSKTLEPKLLAPSGGKYYCVRFLDSSKRPIAALKLPDNNPACQDPKFWQTFKDEHSYYYTRYFPLYLQPNQSWGLLQVARSISDLDIYLMRVEIVLVVMIMLAIVLVGSASWWLAGLALRPARESYQQMQQFTADAAHELRTPLATLRAIVQTALRSDELSLEEAKDALQILNRQSHRLSKLVQDLLLLCQTDQASEKPLTPCCLNAIVTDLTDEFAALASAEQIEFTSQVPEQPIYVMGDPERLYRAIANLVSNAIQYTPANGSVTVLLGQSAHTAFVQVQDTGIGIALNEQQQIFNRFYRVDRGRSRHRGGSGLGLAITQAIVQLHQGSLQVKSEPEQGSLFTISLPLVLDPESVKKP